MILFINIGILCIYCVLVITWILGRGMIINSKKLLLVLYRDRLSKYIGTMCFIVASICFILAIVANLFIIIKHPSDYNQIKAISFVPFFLLLIVSINGIEGINRNGLIIKNKMFILIPINEIISSLEKDKVTFLYKNDKYVRYFLNTKRNRDIILKKFTK